MGYFDPVQDDEEKRRQAAAGPYSPRGQAGTSISGTLLNRQGSPLSAKVMSAASGFMSTFGGAGSEGGGGMMGGMMGGGGAASGSSVPGLEGTSGSAASTGTAVPPPMTSEAMAQRPSSAFGTILGKTGMSPSSAKNIEMLTQLLGQQNDPNRGARNIGKIAGIVARFA